MNPAASVEDNAVKWAEYCGGLLFLALLTPDDIRERRISVGKLVAGMVLALICRKLTGHMNAAEIIGSLVPGIILLLMAVIFRESIGSGDGMAVMVLGLWIGGFCASIAVCLAIMMAGLFAVVYLVRKRRETLPFIPFLLLGMEVLLFYA